MAGALASRRLARPVLVAAPSGWPSASPLAARGSPPGLSGSARRRPAPPGGVFAPLLGSLGRPAASCPLACGGALAPSRPVLGFPPPRRAAARRCSPRLPPPALARLRAGPLAPPAGPPGPSVGARARPGGAPLPRRVCLSLAGGPLLRRAGALGPLRGPRGVAFRAPARWGLSGASSCRLRLPSDQGQDKRAALRPGLDSRGRRRGGVSKGQRPKFASRGLDILHYSWYDDATDSSSVRHNEIATIHGLRAVVGPPVECCYHSAWVAFLLPKVHIIWAVATVARPP